MRKLKLSTLSGWVIALFVLFTSSHLVYSQCPSGSLAGTVYLDENKSGMNESEPGYPNAVVVAYDENNSQVGMALSNSSGDFVISGLTDGDIYRIEFNVPDDVSSGYNAAFESSDIQFLESPTCDFQYSVSDRSLQCGDNSDIVLTCFVRSDGTNNLDYSTIIGIEYGFDGASTPVQYATQAETGSVWGAAYRFSSSTIFTSAFVKQNSALASTHDAIYRTVPVAAGGYSTQVYTTLSALGQSVTPLGVTDAYDCDYGDQVGHLGLGGLAISADEDDLYVINISDNSLVKMSAISPSPSTTVSYSIPDPGCDANENRPFALTEYNGRFYVGVTCTAESTRTSSRSAATVYEFNPNTETFTEIFSTTATDGFWLDTPNTSNKNSHWLTDIEFTDDNNMVLALADRKGHRFCEGPGEILNDQQGDILLVANVNGQWTLENNGQVGGYQGSGVNNGQGPGGGEFFGQDLWLTDPNYHGETSLGSIYALPSTGTIVSAVFDPITEAYSGGLHRYDTNDGTLVEAVQLYGNNSDEYFGKATGFGGIIGKCAYSGIEIGNFAWFDLNANGLQDPEEDSIDGLPLQLLDSNGNIVATTTTNSNGNFAFTSSEHGLDFYTQYYIIIDPALYNADDGTYLLNGTVYQPSITTQVGNNDSNLVSVQASTINTTGQNISSPITNGSPFIPVFTGGNGQNDYSYDLGLSLVENFDLALILTSDTKIGVEGQDVKYTIEIENQGEITANNIKVVNYLPTGMELNDPNWTLAADGMTAYLYINLANGLQPGEMIEECITLTIVDQGDDLVKINYAEIAYTENMSGVDFSPKDIDSTPDEIRTNDFGGEAFSNNDNRLDGSGVVGDDEDDQDPEGLYFSMISISDPCTCTGLDASGQPIITETIVVSGPPNQEWILDFNSGFVNASGVPYPIDTPFIFVSTDPETNVATYELSGFRLLGQNMIIRVMNDDGVFRSIEAAACPVNQTAIIPTSGITAVCTGAEETYQIEKAPNCTYDWEVLDASGNSVPGMITPIIPDGSFASIVWPNVGVFTIVVTPICTDDTCTPVASLPINVGLGNGILACPLDINVSLNDECSVEITPQMILSTPLTAGAAYGIMITDKHGNVLPGSTITGDYLGQTLEVKVIDACSGNACWSNVIVEDKTAPVLICESIEVPCYDIDSYEPIAFDACTTVEVEIIADFPTPIWCDEDYVKSIERTYRATDTYGNSSTCSQTILVKRFPYEEITRPDEEVTITCTEFDANQNAEGFPSPCLTGVPTLFGASLYGEDGCESDLQYDYCDVNFSYTDVLYYVGECKTKYMRTWHFYENNCTPWNYENFTQLIIIEDNESPVFDVALDIHNEIFTSSGSACEASYQLPIPVASDDCATAITYNVVYTTEAGIPTLLDGLTLDDFTAGIMITLPFGDNKIMYTAFDGCDNIAEDMFVITIVDNTSPQAICEGNTVVSLNEDGTAYAPATVFDDGSYDDCSDVEILVQRESICDCPAPTFDGLNFLGTYDNAAGDTHYYYNSVRMVRGYLAVNLSSAYGGYLVDFDDAAEQAFISNLMMVDAYVGGPDFTTLSGGTLSTDSGLALQSFIVEIEDPCGWSSEVHFCCEDYDADNTTVDVEVSVRVIDAFGNIGECIPVNVHIQNKVVPLLDCPDPVQLTCSESTLHEGTTTEEDLNDLYGTFSTDVCGAEIVPTTVWNLDVCGVGVITRTFSALNTSNGSPILDSNGAPVECTMTITIVNDDPLEFEDIIWPVDYLDFEVDCSLTDLTPEVLAEVDEGQYGFPVVPSSPCHYATNPSFSDSEPFVTPDGRIKIIRTWTIFDECNDHNELTYNQRIKVTDLNMCEMLDVALRKTVVTPGPYRGGDIVTFALEVFNQGNVDAFDIGLVDYIPNGMTLATGTVNNANWTSVDANTAILGTPIATVASGDPDPSTTVLIDLLIDADAAGNINNFAEVTSVSNDPNNDPLTDIDSNPDSLNDDVFINDVIDSNPTNGDEDDHDVETIFIEVFDLALIKQVNESLTDEPLMPSGAIAFDITVMNQGNTDAFNVQLADYFPVELVLNDANWTALGSTATLNTPIANIPVGQSVTTTITFAVQDFAFFDANGYDFSQPLSIFNNAEIAAAEDANGPADDVDSQPGDNDDDGEDLSNDDEFDDGDGTEGQDDDFDPSDFEIDIYDLAIDKVLLTAGPYAPGDNVTFSLTVTNEGTLDAAGIQITDMSDEDLIFVSDDSGTNGNVTALTGGTLYSIAALAAGASETVEVTYMIAMDFMGNTLSNSVEITTDDGMDVDSDPGNGSDDEDDDDVEIVTLVQVFDLALIKEVNEASSDSPLLPGGSITFDLTVLNQGTLDATNVVLSDYFPAELILNDANWTAVGNVATLTTPIGTIPAGMSSVVSITFTLEDYDYFVANGIDLSDGLTLVNNAEITAAEDNGVAVLTDEDGTYGDNGMDAPDLANDDSFGDGDGTSPQDDDFDPAEFDVDIYDLAITKSLVSEAPYVQGDIIDFEIVITNEGSLAANGIQFTDTAMSGLTFSADNSMGNANISIVTAGSVWSIATLAPGASETLTVSYLIDVDFVGTTLTNDVMITLDDGDDIDSNPMTGNDVDEDGDMDGDDDDEDQVVVPIGCTIPTCGSLDFTVSLPVSMDIPVSLFPFVDDNNMVQLSTTPVTPTGFEGCEATFTVTLDKDEIACNPKNTEEVKITILDVVAGTEECCVVTITKLDEIPPVLDCSDFTVNCNTLFFDADGNVDVEPFEPEATDNCEPVDITSVVDMSGLDDECNTGTIIIMYTATDCYDNTDMCTQTITVNAVELQESEINFPEDVVLANCDDSTDPAETGTTTVDSDASVCGGLSITFEDDVPADDECQEVITRTWTVVDACALTSDGVFTHQQTITFIDDTPPTITGLPVLDNTYDVLPPSCLVNLSIVGMAADDCSGIDSIYHVINGDTIINSLDASDDFDIGSYTIEFVAVDVCGNVTSEQLEFTVAEPIVPPGISCLKEMFEVGPGGPTVVSPEALAFGGFNCSDTGFEYFFLAGTPGTDVAPTEPITILPNQELVCANLNPYLIYIGLFEDGEYTDEFCVAEIDPVDESGALDADGNDIGDCPMGNDEGSNLLGQIAGKIATESGTIVSDVQVGIIGDMTDMDMSTDQGEFGFSGLNPGGIYRVTPVKDVDHSNGVSTLDIIMIQRHILGLQQLDSPYQYIAADVNSSQSITVKDISELRKLILEIDDRFADNTSWRMVDAGYQFAEGINPLEVNYPERYDIYEFASDMQIDFVGVKIGDVNDSATGPQGPGIATVTRQNQSLLTYSNAAITPGKSQELVLSLESKETYFGFQSRLNFDSQLVDVISVSSELPGFGPEHYTYQDGQLTVSYNTPNATSIQGGALTVTLSARQSQVDILDVLDIDDTYMSELYTTDGISELTLSSISGTNQFAVYQNSPNPFSDYTTIRYKLDDAKEVSIKVFDIAGKVIYTQVSQGERGLNAIQLEKSNFTASGMYYYELTDGSQSVVKRMFYVR